MYYTYVLQSEADGQFYTGYTQDLKLRFAQHNKGQVESTKRRLPLKLIYYEVYPVKFYTKDSAAHLSGACLKREDAARRESYFKTYNGKRFLHKRLKSYLTG